MMEAVQSIPEAVQSMSEAVQSMPEAVQSMLGIPMLLLLMLGMTSPSLPLRSLQPQLPQRLLQLALLRKLRNQCPLFLAPTAPPAPLTLLLPP